MSKFAATPAASVTAAITAAMEEEGLSRAELARRMGCTRGNVTHLLSGDHPLTVRTLGRVARALGRDLQVYFVVRSIEDGDSF